MEKVTEILIKEASKDIVLLRNLKELAVNHQKYEFAAELRELERENFSVEDKNHSEYKKTELLKQAILLLDITPGKLKILYILKEACSVIEKKGDSFGIKEAAKIKGRADEIFGE